MRQIGEFRHNTPVPLSHNGNDIGLCILVVVNVQNPSTAHPRRVKPFMQGGQQQRRSACFYSAFPSEQAVNLCPDPPYLGACLPAILAWSRDKGISTPNPPTLHPPHPPPPPKNKQKSEGEKNPHECTNSGVWLSPGCLCRLNKFPVSRLDSPGFAFVFSGLSLCLLFVCIFSRSHSDAVSAHCIFSDQHSH